MQTQKKRSAKTAARILETAKQLTVQNGWRNTTVRDICNACGISVGAFYHHFSSKQELIAYSVCILPPARKNPATLPVKICHVTGFPCQ